MKKLFLLLSIIFCSMSSFAGPDVMQAMQFECRASSIYAVGFGFAGNPVFAERIALNECMMRTPYGFICTTDYCRRTL